MFIMAFLCLPLAGFGQDSSIDDFYEKYKDNEKVTSINLTGDLINFVFSSSEEYGEMASKISKLRVLIMEEGTTVNSKDYKQFIKNIKREKFSELIQFKDGGSAIDLHLKEDGDIITNVLITVKGDDGFVLLSLEGLLKFSDLNDLDLNIEGGEYLKQLPDKKKKINRA